MATQRQSLSVTSAHLLLPDVEHVFKVPRGKGATVAARKTGAGGAWSSTLKVQRRIGSERGIVVDFPTAKTLTSASPAATISEAEMVGVDAVVVVQSATPDAAGTYVRIDVTIDNDTVDVVDTLAGGTPSGPGSSGRSSAAMPSSES